MRITAASACKCPIRRRAGSIVFIAGMLSGPELLSGAEVSAGSFRKVVRGRKRCQIGVYLQAGRDRQTVCFCPCASGVPVAGADLQIEH
jgi:hypothetical protein